MMKRGVNGLGTVQRIIVAGFSMDILSLDVHRTSDLCIMLAAEMWLYWLRLMLKLLHSNLLVSAIRPKINVLWLKQKLVSL